MKTKHFGWIVTILGVLSHLILVISALYIPSTRTLWMEKGISGIFTFLGLNFIFLSAEVTLLMRKALSNLNETSNNIENVLDGFIVEKMDEDEFYTGFLSEITKANHTINVSYFAPYPPAKRPTSTREMYYNSLLSQILSNDNVTFRRIIRDTSNNRDWMKDLINQYKGNTSVSLSMISDTNKESMGRILSVQTVDDTKSWIVAVGEHEQLGAHRDLYIENEDINSFLSIYYQRIWDMSNVYLENGVVTDFGSDLLS